MLKDLALVALDNQVLQAMWAVAEPLWTILKIMATDKNNCIKVPKIKANNIWWALLSEVQESELRIIQALVLE